MTTDDDKQIPEPDPWAGLDIGGEAEAEEGLNDLVAEEIPLVVFPPPDAEPVDAETVGSDVQIGTGDSVILAMNNAAGEIPAGDAIAAGDDDGNDDVDFIGAGDRDAHDDGDGAFDDEAIAHELGLLDVDGDAVAAKPLAADDEPGFDDVGGFGEPINEADVDDVAADAGMLAGALPFADGEQGEPTAESVESWQADASTPFTAAVAAAGVAAATAGGRPVAAKKKGGGLGQMVGVVAGGLMALPITYAILIWGFHKDPFKFGKQVPEQLAFLLPQKLQPGYKPPGKADAGPRLDAAPSLDDLPTVDAAALQPSQEPADEPAEASAATAAAEPGAAEPAAPTATEPMETKSAGTAPAEPSASVSSEPTEPSPSAEPAKDAVAAVDAAAARPVMPADSSLAALPSSDALPGLDALVVDAAAAITPAAPATAAALPPLDLTAVETAADRVVEAGDALVALSDSADPGRDRQLVVWYRRLARLGEELVRLETMAADTGRSPSPTPAVAADLLDHMCGSATAVADLERLGGMWLTSESRRADGVALIATLGTPRQVGPYWSTRATIAAARDDGTDRSVAIISRMAPPVEAGERFLVAGVMFDGDAIWASDVRPVTLEAVAAQPEESGGGQE